MTRDRARERPAAPRPSIAQPSCCRASCCADEPLDLHRPRHRHRAGQVDRLAAAAGARAHRLVHRDDAGGVRRGLAVRALRQPARPARRAGPAGASRRSRRSAQPPARPSTSPSPAATGRPDRAGRLDLPARHARLGRRRGAPRTARHWARSSTPAARCRLPTARLERRTDTRSPRPASALADGPRAGPQRGYAVTRGRARDRARRVAAPVSTARRRRSSPRSASPDRATGSVTSFDQLGRAADRPCQSSCPTLLRRPTPRRRAPHDARRDPQGLYDETLRRQRACGAGPDPARRSTCGMAPQIAAVRRADPVARGGRRPLRAR